MRCLRWRVTFYSIIFIGHLSSNRRLANEHQERVVCEKASLNIPTPKTMSNKTTVVARLAMGGSRRCF